MKKPWIILASLMAVPAMAAEKVEPTSVDKLTDFALDKMNAAFAAVQHALPTITEAALTVTRINLLQELAWTVSTLLLAGGLFIISYKLFAWGKKIKAADRLNEDYLPVYIVATIVCGIGTAALIIGFVSLFNVWVWVGLFHPDLYIIHQVLEKVTS